MKKIMIQLLVVSAAMTMMAGNGRVRIVSRVQVKQTVDSALIFTYSPSPRGGLFVAAFGEDHRWKTLCGILTSDYGNWGSEKRMVSPYLFRKSEGEWKAVWQVNDYAPCFATAVSENLIDWHPQDYPRMHVNGCLSPITVSEGNGFSVLFKDKEGRVYATRSADFHHFNTDQVVPSERYMPESDTATIDGKCYSGQKWKVSSLFIQNIKDHQRRMEEEGEKNKEQLSGDGMRFSEQQKWNLPLTAVIDIQADLRKKISDRLIGVFFEDISYAADGGLYAEMVQNRDFEYASGENHHNDTWGSKFSWSSDRDFAIDTVMPLSAANPHYAIIERQALSNNGWDGLSVKKFSEYHFSMFTRCLDKNAMTFRVSLTAGGKILAWKEIRVKDKMWGKTDCVLVCNDDADNAVLRIEPMKSGRVGVDMISLFPKDTFHGRENGLRNDLAQTIANLHPKFMRFPGGCMSHGDGLDNIYRWKESIGSLQDRVPARNIWNYHQTRGLGFYEFFQFCEDIGCEPLPVLAAGVPCQNSASDKDGFGGQQGGIPMKEMPEYVQDILDLIAWANDDPLVNKWAKMRADAGHPAPFKLHYIGIGNEDLISTVFKERYLMICKAIKEKYPDIQVCGTVGPFHRGSSDYREGWKIANENRDIIDMVDEHYYESTGWFMHNQDYYDEYDRSAPKVYLGEYAASTSVKRSNVETALAEALYLCHVERNADVVSMTSYAPLLAKEGHTNWNPDMIYFSNSHITTTPSYMTQQLFSKYAGDQYIESHIVADSTVAYRLASSLVKDSKTGNMYLKLVNMLPVQVSLTMNLASLNVLPFSSEGFNGSPEDRHVKVDAQQIAMNGSVATIVLKPYSFEVVILK